MSADLRMNLESELDTLSEEQVESWLQRCFEDCDPRYDSDWLNGIFELALMQFPDNYEVRAAASKAAIMDAQRLNDEGDQAEAISRLERLLENDPYCTEAFEMLERLMAGGSAEPSAPPPAAVEAPSEAPLVEALPPEFEPALPEELDFLSDDLLSELAIEPSLPDLELELSESVSSQEAPLDSQLSEVEAATLEAPPAAPPEAIAPEEVAVEPAPVATAEPISPPAATTEPILPTVAPISEPMAPTPVASAVVTSAAVPSADWKSAVMLPADPGGLDAALISILPNLAERMRAATSFRSLTLLLADLLQREPNNAVIRQSLNETLQTWSQSLESQGRGSEAGQVAQFAQQTLSESQAWAQAVSARFPASVPMLPALSPLTANGAPAWMAWVEPLKADPSRFAEAGQALKEDPSGLQSLFRHLAVHHASHPEHVLNLGWAYSVTGQHALAMVHTQRSLSMQASPRAQQLLKQIYADLGQPELAQRV